jgi:hypothetical protein
MEGGNGEEEILQQLREMYRFRGRGAMEAEEMVPVLKLLVVVVVGQPPKLDHSRMVRMRERKVE